MTAYEHADELLTKVEDSLRQEDWRRANECTRLLLAFDGAWIERLSVVDDLWTNYSNGHFGFSRQVRVWRRQTAHDDQSPAGLKETFENLGSHIGWREGGWWRCWSDAEYWSTQVFVPRIHADTHKESICAGCLPFHDVLGAGDWKKEFSPRLLGRGDLGALGTSLPGAEPAFLI